MRSRNYMYGHEMPTIDFRTIQEFPCELSDDSGTPDLSDIGAMLPTTHSSNSGDNLSEAGIIDASSPPSVAPDHQSVAQTQIQFNTYTRPWSSTRFHFSSNGLEQAYGPPISIPNQHYGLIDNHTHCHSGTREPSQLDWFKNRTLIEKLYESHTLKEVQHEMKTKHDFHASLNMYKKRIREWNIDKKIKTSEMLDIIDRVKQRKAQGRSSIVLVRGRRVPLAKITRSNRRLSGGERPPSTSPSRSSTPTDVEIYTPPPSPRPPLTGPAHLEALQYFLILRERYIEGSLESNIWIIDDSSIRTDSSTGHALATKLEHRLKDSFFSSLRTLDAQDTSVFRHMLDECTTDFAQLTVLNSPNTLSTILNMVFYALNEGKLLVIQTLLRCFIDLIATTTATSPQHALQGILQTLNILVRTTPPHHLKQALRTTNQSSINTWSRHVHPIQPSLLTQKLDQIMYHGDSTTRQHDITTFTHLIQSTDTACSPADPRPWLLRVRYANYARQDPDGLATASTTYQHVIEHSDNIPAAHAAFYLSECFRGQAKCLERAGDGNGNAAAAQSAMRNAIQLREAERGRGDARALTFRIELDEMVARNGWAETADVTM